MTHKNTKIDNKLVAYSNQNINKVCLLQFSWIPDLRHQPQYVRSIHFKWLFRKYFGMRIRSLAVLLMSFFTSSCPSDTKNIFVVENILTKDYKHVNHFLHYIFIALFTICDKNQYNILYMHNIMHTSLGIPHFFIRNILSFHIDDSKISNFVGNNRYRC